MARPAPPAVLAGLADQPTYDGDELTVDRLQRAGGARCCPAPARAAGRLRRAASPLLTAAALARLAACGSTALASPRRPASGDRKGFVAGDGSVERLAPRRPRHRRDARRHTLAAPLRPGRPPGQGRRHQRLGLLVRAVRGRGPRPAAGLAADSRAARPVAFVGINVHDTRAPAPAFLQALQLTYPTLADDGGRSCWRSRGTVRPTTPTHVGPGPAGPARGRVAGAGQVIARDDAAWPMVDDAGGGASAMTASGSRPSRTAACWRSPSPSPWRRPGVVPVAVRAAAGARLPRPTSTGLAGADLATRAAAGRLGWSSGALLFVLGFTVVFLAHSGRVVRRVGARC